MMRVLLAIIPAAFFVQGGGQENAREYEPTKHSQHLSITNGFDTNTPWRVDQDDRLFSIVNPNRISPIAGPGGLAGFAGVSSRLTITIPDGRFIRYWTERVEAGARRPLPRYSWRFPEGTVIKDELSYKGKVFEVRGLEKRGGSWVTGRPFRDRKARPPGYDGVAGNCMACHDRAGEQPGYGISWRGSDGIFSWNLLDEGTNRVKQGWPIKQWNEP